MRMLMLLVCWSPVGRVGVFLYARVIDIAVAGRDPFPGACVL